MNWILPVCSLLLLPVPRIVLPSDPTGVFATIDKVVLKPNAEQPTEVELHGAFATAEGPRGNHYTAPRRGVLRFGAGEKPDEAVRQWRELGTLAGTGRVVAFGSRWAMTALDAPPVRVMAADALPARLPAFATDMGLHVVDGVNHGPRRELQLLPRCEKDAAIGNPRHAHWSVRDVTFTCQNCAATDADLAYVFVVETGDGDRFASGPVPPGQGRTSWRTDLELDPGETVTWSVHVVGPKVERAPIDRATFVAPARTDRKER